MTTFVFTRYNSYTQLTLTLENTTHTHFNTHTATKSSRGSLCWVALASRSHVSAPQNRGSCCEASAERGDIAPHHLWNRTSGSPRSRVCRLVLLESLSWDPWGHLGDLSDYLGGLWRHLGTFLNPSYVVLRSSWDPEAP